MLPANEPFGMCNVCDMTADDMSIALMELPGRAKIEQVDFLREALATLQVIPEGTVPLVPDA